jgi:hypothetical protein
MAPMCTATSPSRSEAADPAPGSLWAIRSGRGELVVYRVEGIDGDGDYQLRLVEIVRTGRLDRTVGDLIRVERAWFSVRADVSAVRGAA